MKMHPLTRFHAPLTLGLLLVAECVAADIAWRAPACPYRARVRLARPVDAPVVLSLDAQEIIDAVAAVAVDQVNQETFAFERAVAVNPSTGAIVGRFHLMADGSEIDVDGAFAGLQSGKSPWLGFAPAKMSFAEVDLDGSPATALLIEEKQISNSRLQQRVQLAPRQRYLLDYWVMMDAQDNELSVMLHRPELQLFSNIRHSYFPRMPPQGRWARNRVIFRPEPANEEEASVRAPVEADLEISHAIIGRAGVSRLSLRPVAWRLVVEPDEPLEEICLYAIARAGHRFTTLSSQQLHEDDKADSVNARVQDVQVQSLNPQGVVVTSGETEAWTIDPALPLKVGRIRGYRPLGGTSDAAQATVCQGTSASVVLAIDTGTARLDNLSVSADLPAEATFHRLATIPVYDGPTVDGEVKGRLIETRYEAMVPLDYQWDRPATDGIHLLVATITPTAETPAGVHNGKVTVEYAGGMLEVPVALRVAPVTLQPKRHFGALFGGSLIIWSQPAGSADMSEDTISIAEYHGVEPSAANNEAGELDARAVAERYYHALLDHHLAPNTPDYLTPLKLDVVDRGEGKAPRLTNWDFSQGYDQAIREFVIDRNMPWLMVYHTNGHLMHKFTLNGVTYSYEPNPGNSAWVQLPRDEFDRLVGDYFETLARHLDELGVLDRTLLVVDESGLETFDTIHAFVKAVRARPYARRIKIGHTTHRTSVWTRRLPGGGLLMDEVLDVPMPDNDEHFNFFEPEWNSRFTQRPKTQWVYMVESDHLNLENAGLSSSFLPLRLEHLGVDGWYDWESFMWSLTYAYLPGQRGGFKYGTGPVINPWANPFYHHGPGVLSFFYPPDARGPARAPTDLVIPSFRLTLMRDGIQQRALLEVLRAGQDDASQTLHVDATRLQEAEQLLDQLWPGNPVQWYLGYQPYRSARSLLDELAMEAAGR